MKIALDAELTIGTATGIGEYVRGLSDALRAQGADIADLCEPNLDPWRFDRRLRWDQWLLPRYARAANADVLHCTSGTMPLARLRKRDGSNLPIVVTVHDVAWLRVQSHTKWYARLYFGAFALARYRTAERIIVDSEFSRDELLEVLFQNDARAHIPPIEVVYPGVAHDYCTLTRGTIAPIVLVPGTVEPRKNLAFLIRILSLLPSARLVSVGPHTPYADECRLLASELKVEDRLDLRGYVSREELLRLYATCAVVAVPSTYEGFGYAAAQALCAGVPLIVSNCGSLPEVARSGGTIAALERETWREALDNALQGTLDASTRIARHRAIERFAWPSVARSFLRVYERLAKS